MVERRIHDYRQRYWGHDISIKPDPDPLTARITGWGYDVQQHDLLIVSNGDGFCFYEIESIERPGEPGDMWFANCRFVPASSDLGQKAIAALGKSAVLSAMGMLTSWRVLDD